MGYERGDLTGAAVEAQARTAKQADKAARKREIVLDYLVAVADGPDPSDNVISLGNIREALYGTPDRPKGRDGVIDYTGVGR